MTWDNLPLFVRVILRGIGLLALLATFVVVLIVFCVLVGNYFGVWTIPILFLGWVPFAIAYEIETG